LTAPSRIPSLGPRGEGWVALQFVLLGAVAVAGLVARTQLEGAASTAALIGGALLIAAGIVLALLGVRDLGRSLSPMPRPTDEATLVEHGVFRLIRHPIYSGLLLVALGWSLATTSWLALGFGALLAVVLDLKSRREEAWLRERFATYGGYMARTKRFVPGVY
jgi:protein-S-isoprenylcysteine O-methyltransferase Ste14